MSWGRIWLRWRLRSSSGTVDRSKLPLCLGARLLALLSSGTRWFEPAVAVAECRDPADDKYLELALAAGAGTIVSSDRDLLVLRPWRGVRILRPAEHRAVWSQPRWRSRP